MQALGRRGPATHSELMKYSSEPVGGWDRDGDCLSRRWDWRRSKVERGFLNRLTQNLCPHHAMSCPLHLPINHQLALV